MNNLGLQMYSLMDGAHNEWRENIKIAKEIGFSGVELFGPCFNIPATEMKELLLELDLVPISLHEQSDKIEERLEYAKTLDMKFIGIGMEMLKNEGDVKNFAKKLNDLGRITKEQGIMLTYHNHTQEFAKFDTDKTIIETLIDETDKDLVGFELDAGWCAAAGVDPVSFIKKYFDRIKLVHIKESSKVIGPQPPMDFGSLEKDENGSPIFSVEMLAEMDRIRQINCKAGEGLVDWKKLIEVVKQLGLNINFIVEREYSEIDRVEALKLDFEHYSNL